MADVDVHQVWEVYSAQEDRWNHAIVAEVRRPCIVLRYVGTLELSYRRPGKTSQPAGSLPSSCPLRLRQISDNLAGRAVDDLDPPASRNTAPRKHLGIAAPIEGDLVDPAAHADAKEAIG